MLTVSLSTMTSFALIILIGLLTWFSDIKYRKIRNDHLFVVGCLAIGMIFVNGFWGDLTFVKTKVLSVVCAVTISLVFYVNNLWRGGDAKLFTLYSILMPPTGYDSKMFVPAIVLFVNTFIIALIYVCFFAIIGVCFRPNVFRKKMSSFLLSVVTHADFRSFILNVLRLRAWREFVRATWLTLCISWVLFPIFEMIGIPQYKSLSFLIIYLVNLTFFRRLEEFNRNIYLIVGVLILGLVLRVPYFSGALPETKLFHYFKTVITYSAMSLVLYNITKSVQRSEARVAFAPFLFLGCLLSYTPFLSIVMSLQEILRGRG